MEQKAGFKRKTIEKIIRAKVDQWLKSITDEGLRREIKHDYLLSGGAIASMLLGDAPNDFDFYFQTTSVAAKVANYYVNKFKEEQKDKGIDAYSNVTVIEGDARVHIKAKSIGVLEDGGEGSEYQYFEMLPPKDLESYLHNIEEKKAKKDFKVAFLSENAITLYGGVQIIIRFCGDASVIHKNFDFAHCMQYFTEDDGLVLNVDSLVSLMARELKYVGSLYPICSLFRIRKFLQRGFTITAGEILKISYDVNQLDLNDFTVLRDQLVGMDAAYFNEILRILQADSTKEIDRTYLVSIIDKVFDE